MQSLLLSVPYSVWFKVRLGKWVFPNLFWVSGKVQVLNLWSCLVLWITFCTSSYYYPLHQCLSSFISLLFSSVSLDPFSLFLSLSLQRDGQLKFVSSSSRQLGATHNEQIEIDSTMLYLLSKSLICNKTVHKRIILPKNGRIQTFSRMHCNKEWDLSALACVLNCWKKAKDLTAAILCQETVMLFTGLPPPKDSVTFT